jgi:hypothetical protein
MIVSRPTDSLASVALDVEHVRQALAKWADFPVGREPRPIVVTMMDPGVLDRLTADTAWRSVFNGLVVPEAELPLELRSAAIDYRLLPQRADRSAATVGTDRPGTWAVRHRSRCSGVARADDVPR